VALSTVVNICKKLPSESPTPFMEAVPILCNLLLYEDRQVLMNGLQILYIFVFVTVLNFFVLYTEVQMYFHSLSKTLLPA
jgi:hypothetical protein